MNSNQSQRGAFLLILILVLGILSSISLTAYLTLLTHTTRTLTGQLQSEQAHYSVFASFAESLSRYQQQPDWIENVSGTQTDQYTFSGTPITRNLIQSGNVVTLRVTSQVIQAKRSLQAEFALQAATSTPADVVLVIDSSGSMRDGLPPADQSTCDQPGKPVCQPMHASREAAKTLIDGLKNAPIRLAVYQYSNRAILVKPLTALTNPANITGLKQAIDSITRPLGATNIGDGFQKAADEITSSTDTTFIVLITDGIANRRGSGSTIAECATSPTVHTDCTCKNNDPCTNPTTAHPESTVGRAHSAKQATSHPTIFTISLNLNPDDFYPDPYFCPSSGCDEPAILRIAEDTLKKSATTPQHFYPATDENLQSVYQKIAKEIRSATVVTLSEIEPQ